MKLQLSLAGLAWALVSATSAETPASPPYQCEHPVYTPRIISISPLIIYLHNFTTPFERAHLLKKTAGTFRRSAIANPHLSSSHLHSPVRTSTSTYPLPDPILHCISSRALSFQGSIPPSHLEPPQLVRYLPTEHYTHHTDWFSSPSYSHPSLGGNRLSSFFAYLYTSPDLIGGGTNFPMIKAKRGEEWCGILDCDAEWERGVTFRAVEGNAVFWRNLREDGRGDERVIHGAERVERGEKVGMNLWTREGVIGRMGEVDSYPGL